MLKLIRVLLAILGVGVAAVPGWAGNNSGQAFSVWPDTGQTKCYNDTVEIPCPAVGEAFYGQDAQYAGPVRSYAVLDGGTMVQDNVTGLVWEQKTNMNGVADYTNPHDADNTYTWCDPNLDTNDGNPGTCGGNDTQGFIDQLNSANYGGYSDWRLPTIKELSSLVDLGRYHPVIDPIFASTTRSSWYWSSTTVHGSYNNYAYFVGFDSSNVYGINTDYFKSSGLYVRAVRGGQTPSAINQFFDNGDTVIDMVTGLEWQKATVGPLSWKDALASAENLTLDGKNDWRLPNKNELRSLVDYSIDQTGYDLSINPVFAATTQDSGYWSSTTFVHNTNLAWVLGYDGNDDYYVWSQNKLFSGYYVRAVRGTQLTAWYFGHISMTPMSGLPGTTFTESGTGFTPNSTVTLHFRNQLGELQTPVQRATDASGNFTLNYTAPADKPVGTHTWWAVDDTTGKMSEPLGYNIYGTSGQVTPITNGPVSPNLGPVKVNLGFGELTSEGTFDPTKETFVIVHGWNTEDTNALPPWMTAMGNTIQNDDKSPAKGANVLYWNWQDKARAKKENVIWDQTHDASCMDDLLPAPLLYSQDSGVMGMIKVPFDETENSGKYLAAAMLKALPKTYDQHIHFIGHSLGTLVSTYAAKFAKEHAVPFASHIDHIVFLDSPCYGGVPGGKFLNDNKSSIFFENYMSMFGRSYKEADVNVWLQLKAVQYGPIVAHSYPYHWYRSSVTNFSDKDILHDSSAPASTMPYGFYWWNAQNRQNLKSDYAQLYAQPNYLVVEGKYEHWELITKGTLVDIMNAYGDAYTGIIQQLVDYAERAGKIIHILGANTFNTAASVSGFVVDVADHAFYDSRGFLTLKHSSTAVLSIPVNIPAGANALAFGVEFLSGAPGSMLEVLINDIPAFHTTSDRMLGEGLQLMPWINVEPFAGTKATLTLRLSNPNPGTEGEIKIDDLVIAKIEQVKKFPWTMFLPAITHKVQ